MNRAFCRGAFVALIAGFSIISNPEPASQMLSASRCARDLAVAEMGSVVLGGLTAVADFPMAGLFGRGRRGRVCSPANCQPPVAIAADACGEPPASQPASPQPESSQPIESPPHESTGSDQPAAANANAESSPQDSETGWRSLFDGRSLTGWKPAEFGGEGEVGVKDGAMVLDMGYSMTGITSTHKDLPKTNYELSLEAKRLDGTDFFCGLTFPVGDTHCSFIVGGWAGGVVGLSSIDGLDASENQTTKYREFKTDQWYRVRVRVTPERIQTWIDDEQFVDQEIADKRVHIRVEMELSRPLGVATWETKAAVRNVRIRRLPESSEDGEAAKTPETAESPAEAANAESAPESN